jgi:hypothetical protein
MVAMDPADDPATNEFGCKTCSSVKQSKTPM